MANLLQQVNKWEIQLLVLLSYILQAFLFFAGGLRQRSSNRLFRVLVWTAYLGADLVATYALGLISRHDADVSSGSKDSHHLVFLWAPFLLIHLGGQDTITAFALEDDNLWLRHLLNLAVQVALALCLLWKSASSDTSAQLLIPSMLVFVSGTIKYGERTWALRSGVLKILAENPLPRYADQLRESLWKSHPPGGYGGKQLAEQIEGNDCSSDDVGALTIALCSIESVRSFFWHNDSYKPRMHVLVQKRSHRIPKLLEILETELGLVYDYVYTKSMVFQTRGGIMLRCISQIAFLSSFLLFLLSNKQRYSCIDTAVTYALFAGGLFLEVCAVLTTVRSPWTWVWLEARHCSFLASLFTRWWKRKGKWWSESMGQYNMHSYLGQYDKSSSWKHRARKVVDACCGKEQKFWVSKLLDIRFVEVDEEIMMCIFDKIVEYAENRASLPQRWPNLGPLFKKVLPSSDGTLNWHTIATLHTYTEAQLRMYSPGPDDVDGESIRALVRKISHYIVYLLATEPGMLPVSRDAENKDPRREKTETSRAADLDLPGIKLCGMANYLDVAAAGKVAGNKDDALFSRATEMLREMGVPVPGVCTTQQDLLETKEAWMRLLIYIAGRSRPELHATRLSRGGELLTFVWLFMAHRGLGDSVLQRIEATDELVLRGKSLVLFRFPQQPTDEGGCCVPTLDGGRRRNFVPLPRKTYRDGSSGSIIPALGLEGLDCNGRISKSKTPIAMGESCVGDTLYHKKCIQTYHEQ